MTPFLDGDLNSFSSHAVLSKLPSKMVQPPGCVASMYSSGVLTPWWIEAGYGCSPNVIRLFLTLSRVYNLKNHLLWLRIASLLCQCEIMKLLLFSTLSFNAYMNNTGTWHTLRFISWLTQLPSEPWVSIPILPGPCFFLPPTYANYKDMTSSCLDLPSLW